MLGTGPGWVDKALERAEVVLPSQLKDVIEGFLGEQDRIMLAGFKGSSGEETLVVIEAKEGSRALTVRLPLRETLKLVVEALNAPEARRESLTR